MVAEHRDSGSTKPAGRDLMNLEHYEQHRDFEAVYDHFCSWDIKRKTKMESARKAKNDMEEDSENSDQEQCTFNPIILRLSDDPVRSLGEFLADQNRASSRKDQNKIHIKEEMQQSYEHKPSINNYSRKIADQTMTMEDKEKPSFERLYQLAKKQNEKLEAYREAKAINNT